MNSVQGGTTPVTGGSAGRAPPAAPLSVQLRQASATGCDWASCSWIKPTHCAASSHPANSQTDQSGMRRVEYTIAKNLCAAFCPPGRAADRPSERLGWRECRFRRMQKPACTQMKNAGQTSRSRRATQGCHNIRVARKKTGAPALAGIVPRDQPQPQVFPSVQHDRQRPRAPELCFSIARQRPGP